MARKHGLMGEVNLLGLNSLGENPGLNPIVGALIGGGTANLTSMAVGNLAMFQTMTDPSGMPVSQDRHMWGFLAGLATAGIMWLTGPDRARHAAWGAAAGAFIAEGLPWLEKFIMGTVEVPLATASAGAAVVASASSATASGTPTTVAVTVPVAASPTGAATVSVTTSPATAPAAAGTSGALGMPRVAALNGLGMRRQAGGQMLNGGLGIARAQALNGGLGLATVAAQPQSVGTIPGVAGPSFAGAQFGATNRPPVQLLGNPTSQSRQVQLLGGPAIHGLSSAYGATLLGGGRG